MKTVWHDKQHPLCAHGHEVVCIHLNIDHECTPQVATMYDSGPGHHILAGTYSQPPMDDP